jgi:hypothetical protein
MYLFIPTFIIRAFHHLKTVSDWVDETFFPLPKSYKTDDLIRTRLQQQKVENAANYISKQIKYCNKIAQCNSAKRMIDNLTQVYGPSTQVTSWQDSLRMQLYYRENEIISKL